MVARSKRDIYGGSSKGEVVGVRGIWRSYRVIGRSERVRW